MKVFTWICISALLSGTNGEVHSNLLSKEIDGENADWFNRVLQTGSMSPPPPPPTPPPTATPPPTPVPTPQPTVPPTPNPTSSLSPTQSPSVSLSPTKSPTPVPTGRPSTSPTKSPTQTPSTIPSLSPTDSKAPSSSPTTSMAPSDTPSSPPTDTPSNPPSLGPTPVPTMSPSENPTNLPTTSPSKRPTTSPTMSPTQTPLQLVPVLGVFFLQRCQGDCNADTDCAFGLVCQQRNRGTSSISGCSGNADLIGTGNENYCVPPSGNRLVIVGDDINGVQTPAGVFPLQRCQGDCNNDDDCAGNLVCRQRDDNAPVTGCSDRGATGFDYCYAPGPTDLVYLGDDDEGFDGTGPPNLARCRGDCDEDTDCENGLVCFQRDFEPRSVPGCSGDAFQIGNGDDDFCIQASANTLNFRGDNGQPASAFPLGACQGDCDTDAECAGNLICFQRAEFEDVPGCTGFGVSGFDYCSAGGRDGDVGENTTTVETPEETETEEQEVVPDEEKGKDSLNRFFLFGGKRN
ncbi:unnamed protein product [Cylindrotheca closterium]|uniref:Uncharacterized protein n=1 Tax=Cylindrotheca closterium TaxID=2856 RepID=A0AAD2G758_9STRA|nr:unnamed protein product [Cylindrotheca closterium]